MINEQFSDLGSSLSETNFEIYSHPQICTNDNFGTVPIHISYGVFCTD